MNPNAVRSLFTVLLLVSFGSVYAGPGMDWVQKMSDAMRNLSYRGNFVYLHANQLESMSIYHVKNKSGEKERLLSLNGEAREVIRDNKNLTCIWPSSRKVVVDVSRQNSFSPIFIPDDIVRIGKFYDIRLAGLDRIAGQDSVVVHIKPKDEYRYGMMFWINTENNLLMKSNLINERGEIIEQVMFTNLEVISDEQMPEIDTMPELDDSFTLIRYHSGDSSGNLVADRSWGLTNTPAGFWQESALKRNIPETGQSVQQMVYTDGLASLSVFIEKSSLSTPQGGTSMGAVNAYMRIYNEFSVTAIGEVPEATVKRVAESIYYQQQ